MSFFEYPRDDALAKERIMRPLGSDTAPKVGSKAIVLWPKHLSKCIEFSMFFYQPIAPSHRMCFSFALWLAICVAPHNLQMMLFSLLNSCRLCLGREI